MAKFKQKSISDYFKKGAKKLKMSIQSDPKFNVDKKLKVRKQMRDLSNRVKHLRRCGQKRWSALISRIGTANGLKDLLGEARWNQFLHDSRAKYEGYLKRFSPESLVLKCVGPLDEGICPRSFRVDVLTGTHELHQLHLDHEFDLNHVCDVWKSKIVDGRCWNGTMSKNLLLWLLFEALEFRCFKGYKHNSCHSVGLPHYERILDESWLSGISSLNQEN